MAKKLQWFLLENEEDYQKAVARYDEIKRAKPGTVLHKVIDAWIDAYGSKLKPELKLGEFRFLNRSENDWQSVQLATSETQWGGEPAAGLLTNYLRPGKLKLYTAERKVDLIKQFHLVPQEDGVLEIYQRFWKFTDCATDTVPELLVYADLINTGDSRNLETAKKIYDERIRGKF